MRVQLRELRVQVRVLSVAVDGSRRERGGGRCGGGGVVGVGVAVVVDAGEDGLAVLGCAAGRCRWVGGGRGAGGLGGVGGAGGGGHCGGWLGVWSEGGGHFGAVVNTLLSVAATGKSVTGYVQWLRRSARTV